MVPVRDILFRKRSFIVRDIMWAVSVLAILIAWRLDSNRAKMELMKSKYEVYRATQRLATTQQALQSIEQLTAQDRREFAWLLGRMPRESIQKYFLDEREARERLYGLFAMPRSRSSGDVPPLEFWLP